MQTESGGPPSIWRLVGEAGALAHRIRFDAVRRVAARHDGQGRPVVVLPGFMVHDVISTRLRRTLIAAGYDARGWGMGLNRGLRPETMSSLEALLLGVHAETGRPVALVGWSLGGLFAREVAKLRPEAVERVVTLASPFSGDPRANNLWRISERLAGHPGDAPPIDVRLSEKPPVPTIAICARWDGLISPACTRGKDGERDHVLDVDCRHTDVISNPAAIAAILDVLAMDVQFEAQ